MTTTASSSSSIRHYGGTAGCALLLSLAACLPAQTSPSVPQPTASSDVSVAQHDSETAYTSAARAEAHARAQAEAADRAEQRAIEKQTEAQAARQQALQMRRAAEDAQREAIVAGKAASQRADSEAQRALQDQPRAQLQSEQASPLAMTSGTIESVGQDELVLQRDNAPSLRLKIDPQTTILLHGQPAQLDSLGHGSHVAVSYRMERDQPIAQTIDTDAMPAAEIQPQPFEPQP
jgi:hypothetical protein